MIVDILVGAVLLISAVIAFLRGFIREALTIAGVVGGMAAAYAAGPLLAPHMFKWIGGLPESELEEPQKLFDIIPYDLLADALAYGAIFILVLIIISIISHFLAETVRSIGLGAVDRSLGVVFGVVRGVLVLGLLYLPAYLFVSAEEKDAWFENSNTYVYLEKTSGYIAKFLPKDKLEEVEKNVEEAGGALDTRERLEEMKLLRKKAEEGTLSDEDQKKLRGYDEEFRQNMDRLFEEQSGPQYNE